MVVTISEGVLLPFLEQEIIGIGTLPSSHNNLYQGVLGFFVMKDGDGKNLPLVLFYIPTMENEK